MESNFLDKRLEHFFLMGSFVQPLSLIAAYLAISLKIGPKLMQNRRPFTLRPVMILYNLIQIVGNGYIFIMGAPILKTCSILCTVTETSTSAELPFIVTIHHRYIMLKVVDLVETIIFVIRKKHNQVSTLHLFHHVGVFFTAWISFKYSPGGQNFLSATTNSFVHVFMYSYYLASIWIDVKNVWWKKYITMFQVVCNWFILLNNVVPLVNPYCSFPKWILLLNISYMVILLHMFHTFYKKSYDEQRTKLQ